MKVSSFASLLAIVGRARGLEAVDFAERWVYYSWVRTYGSRITDLICCGVPTFGQILELGPCVVPPDCWRGGIVLVLLLGVGSGSQQKAQRVSFFNHWGSSLGQDVGESIIARAGAAFRN